MEIILFRSLNIKLLLAAFLLVYGLFAQADSCITATPQPMLFWCAGGLCVPNPTTACPPYGSISTFQQCSEQNYSNFGLRSFAGNLSYLGHSIDSAGRGFLSWDSERNGRYGTSLGAIYCDQFWVSAPPPPDAACNSCDQNSVADPINPATGAMFKNDSDFKKPALPFYRYFNSRDQEGMLGLGWRHSYSRKITAVDNSVAFRKYISDPDNSRLYPTIAQACTDGFAQIKSRVSNWGNVVATFTRNLCVLSENGVDVGVLRIYSSSQIPDPFLEPLGFNLVRDDGRLIFYMANSDGTITSPTGTNYLVQKTSAGFSVVDHDSNVEKYDLSGRLLSITARNGVLKTMAYDSAGRLSKVEDSYSNQLILMYDSQGRLTSVKQQ